MSIGYVLVCIETRERLVLGKWCMREGSPPPPGGMGFEGWRDDNLGRCLTSAEVRRAIEMFIAQRYALTFRLLDDQGYGDLRDASGGEDWRVINDWAALNAVSVWEPNEGPE